MAHYRPLSNPSSFRKLAAAMWRAPNDSHVFGSVDIEMSAALDFIKSYNQHHGCKTTVTHLVVRALALALSKMPECNAKVGFSRIWLRNNIDIFCQVSTEGGRDLSGYKVEQADRLSMAAIANQLTSTAQKIRANRDPAFSRSRCFIKRLPFRILGIALRLMSLIANNLNLHFPKYGMPRDPFGSAMVTSVGMLGIDTGFAPLVPVARCPMMLTITRVQKRPWVVDDRVEARPVLRLCGTFDHRIIDGFHAAKLSSECERLITHPDQLLTLEERAGWPQDAAIGVELNQVDSAVARH